MPGLRASTIVVHCIPEEIEKYHLSDLREDVSNTNAKYRQYLVELAQDEVRQNGKEQEERRLWDEMKRRLNFD